MCYIILKAQQEQIRLRRKGNKCCTLLTCSPCLHLFKLFGGKALNDLSCQPVQEVFRFVWETFGCALSYWGSSPPVISHTRMLRQRQQPEQPLHHVTGPKNLLFTKNMTVACKICKCSLKYDYFNYLVCQVKQMKAGFEFKRTDSVMKPFRTHLKWACNSSYVKKVSRLCVFPHSFIFLP